MIDEKIEEAQEEIYEDMFLFNGENIYFDNDDEEEMYYSGQIKEAIKLGANWALEQFLKDLWHPSDEEPELVGERVTIEVVETETATCTGCFFDSKNICYAGLKCAASNRSDGRNVIFKEVKE